MTGNISDIKNPWKRRTLLCTAIAPAVALYILCDTIERLIETVKDAVITFKDVWKGE